MNKYTKLIAAIVFSLPQALYAVDFKEMLSHAQKGDHKAQLTIGLSYYFGEYKDGFPVQKDYDQALKWLLLSAEGGNSYAQFHLGGMYHEGIGVEKNDKEAAKWFLKSAKQGNAKARTNMASFYYYGTAVEQNHEEAYAWASLAAFQGNENAKKLMQMIIPKLKDQEKANLLAGDYFKKYGVKDPYE